VRPGRLVAVGGAFVIGGAVPWLASMLSLKLLDSHSGPPLLLAQTVTMPLVAFGTWLTVSRLWPGRARLVAFLLALSIWLVPGLYLLFSDVGRPGRVPLTLLAVPSLLASGPMILSVYMLNSLGLIATLGLLCCLTVWRQREMQQGA